MTEDLIDIPALLDRFLRRVFVDMGDEIKDVELPVTQQDIRILMVIHKYESISIGKLVLLIHRDKSQITRKVKELESNGILSRRQSEEDQRVIILRLTPLGIQAAEKVQRILHGVLGKILEPLSQNEKNGLAKILQKIL